MANAKATKKKPKTRGTKKKPPPRQGRRNAKIVSKSPAKAAPRAGGKRKTLAELRHEVGALDDQLYTLMAARIDLARQIGVLKQAADLPIKDYRVEKEVIGRSVSKARELGLYATMAEETARLLIKYAVLAQDENHQRQRRASTSETKRVLIAGGRGRMGRWLSEYFESFGHHVSHYDISGGKPSGSGARRTPKTPLPYPEVDSLRGAACDFDVIVLSTPIAATAALIDELTKTPTQALIFDICSLKTPLLPALARAAGAGRRITSVHPMFGPGVDALSGRNILLCQTGDKAATAAARSLFADTTATLIELPLARHDQLMSYVLGLSHLSNLLFAQVLAGSGLKFHELKAVASTTFNTQLDVTLPVVAENQQLYYEIQAENAFTGELLKALGKAAALYGKAIASRDAQSFCALMAESRAYLTEQGA